MCVSVETEWILGNPETGDVLNSSHLMKDMFGYRRRMEIKYLRCS